MRLRIMEEKPKVYIETSVVSYLVARPSHNLIVAARQLITNDWWVNGLRDYDPYVSSFVMDEALDGDSEYAQKRESALSDFMSLDATEEILEVADFYLQATGLPEKCRLDCEHMACASAYEMNYLVSWNCKHIVNDNITKKIKQANDKLGLMTPIICTPEFLNQETI